MNKKGSSRVLFAVILILVIFLSILTINGFTANKIKIDSLSSKVDLGLDLSGGVYVVLEAATEERGQELSKKMQQAKAIIEQRVNGLGVSEQNVTIENNDRIRIELAGMEKPNEAIELIGKTAQLQFMDIEGNIIVTGENVKKSEVAYDDKNRVSVALEFDKVGTEKFYQATKSLMERENSYERIISIVLDDAVISAPVVSDVIVDGQSIITGDFTIERAGNLANLIRAGALPVAMNEIELSSVGPTLGLEALHKSINAAIIGIILVFLFMIIYYRLPGIAASLALTSYIIIFLAVFVYIDAKLTLPGIAGLILSIGMAVDSNIVIFERIKEEIAMGKSLRSSLDSGYKRAMTTIIDANVTTVIAGIVLYNFGTGPIRGFAVTLLIGIATSLFTAVFITKLLLKIIINMKLTKNTFYFGYNGGKK